MQIKRNENGDIVVPVEIFKTILQDLPSYTIRDGLAECKRLVEEQITVLPVHSNKYELVKTVGGDNLTWTPDDVRNVYSALEQPINEDTVGIDTNFYIERSLRSDYVYLTISDGGSLTREWTQNEIDLINAIFKTNE